MSERILRVVAAAILALIAWRLPIARKSFVQDLTRADAQPVPGPNLPAAPESAPLPETTFVRVVLVDGVNRADAQMLPAWSALCARGVELEVDVGFPTVSLPVQVALWTGLTQQQTGILYHSGFPLNDPLGPRSIPAQVALRGGSIAIAESHPYIIQSLGFGLARPPLEPKVKGWEFEKPPADVWGQTWQAEATAAVTSMDRLAFVHILRVDSAGHKFGRGSPAWKDALASADQILGELIAAGDQAHPDARWIVLADHGHVAKGGHAGADRSIRRVRACIAGPGVVEAAGTDRGGPIALVDLSRAIADSLGVSVAPGSAGRPLAGALAAPLRGDELVPQTTPGRKLFAALVLLLGALITGAALGWRGHPVWAPWWWAIAIAGVLIAIGVPDLSGVYVYSPKGDAVADPARWGVYLAVLWTAAAVLYGGHAGWRIALAQVALPLAGMCAALILCGGLPVLWGDATVPITPHWTAWASVLMVISSRACWAVALALLATSVLPAFDPAARRGTRRSGS